MAFAVRKYSALLNSLSMEMGLDVVYGRPEIVNGGVCPPPSGVFPGTLCYMVTVEVSGKTFVGFGPKPMIARKFAEYEAYRTLSAMYEASDAGTSSFHCQTSLPTEAETEDSDQSKEKLRVGCRGASSEGASTHSCFSEGFRSPKSDHYEQEAGRPVAMEGDVCSVDRESSHPYIFPPSNSSLWAPSSTPQEAMECNQYSEIPLTTSMKGLTVATHHLWQPGVGKLGQSTAYTSPANALLEVAKERGLNVDYEISCFGPPHTRQYEVTAIAGGLRCHSKQPTKGRAKNEASTELIQALKKRVAPCTLPRAIESGHAIPNSVTSNLSTMTPPVPASASDVASPPIAIPITTPTTAPTTTPTPATPSTPAATTTTPTLYSAHLKPDTRLDSKEEKNLLSSATDINYGASPRVTSVASHSKMIQKETIPNLHEDVPSTDVTTHVPLPYGPIPRCTTVTHSLIEGFDENLSDSDSDTCSEVTCHGLFEVLPDPHTQFVVQSVNGPVATADDQVDPIVKHKGTCCIDKVCSKELECKRTSLLKTNERLAPVFNTCAAQSTLEGSHSSPTSMGLLSVRPPYSHPYSDPLYMTVRLPKADRDWSAPEHSRDYENGHQQPRQNRQQHFPPLDTLQLEVNEVPPIVILPTHQLLANCSTYQ